MSDRLHAREDQHRSYHDDARAPAVSPGKRTLTAGLVARKAERDSNGVAAGADVAVDRAAGSSGFALPDALRGQFESSLGADLSGVRIHTGSESAEASRAVGAKAYTTGQDIHFGAGYYDPTSAFGTHLLAHEVAHTVQQQGAAPTRQNKLEVSSPQDAAEHEADRAADAMVAGREASVSMAVGVSRKMIQRDQELEPMVVTPEAESIKDTMADASNKSKVADDSNYTWGSASIQVDDGKGKATDDMNNPLVSNAKRNGSLEKLKQISTELDIVKPPMLAWKAANAAAVAAGGAAGINPDTPMAYEKDFKRMKTELEKGETNAMGKVLDSLRAAQKARQKTAMLGLKASMKSLESAKAKFEGHKVHLAELKTRKEVQKNQAAMAEINGQIAGAVQAITYIGKAVSILAGGIGALESGDVKLAQETTFLSGHDIKANPAMPKEIAWGAGKVEGAGGHLTTFFEMTLWKGEIDKIKQTESKLNAQLSVLAAQGIQAQSISVAADLDAAMSTADAAKQNKEDADREFHNAIIQAGKNFDQREMTDKEKKADTVDAKAHITGENSMEGLMAVYSCMVKRSHSRSAFLKAAEGCPTLKLKDATKLVQQVMDSGKISKGDPSTDGMGHFTRLDDPENAGPSGVDHIVAGELAQNLTGGISMALSHLEVAKNVDAGQSAIEQAWDQLVAMGSSGNVGSQI